MKSTIRCKRRSLDDLASSKILIGRNVQRSPVVSRCNNNVMWAMAEQLEAIAKRINKKYP